MTCYVDTVRDYPNAGLRHTRFCHLLADTRAELHAMAAALGIPRAYFQDHPWRWHHDLPEPLRPRAIELGAREVGWHEIAALLKRRRAEVSSPSSPSSSDPGARNGDAGEEDGRWARKPHD